MRGVRNANSLAESFDDKWIPITESGCWIWESTQSRGYGQFRVKGKYIYAHRVSYEMHVGPIPHGLTLDHICRVKCCVNPHHLEPCTMRVNLLRGNNVCAKNARKTHCKHGHPFDDFNTYVWNGPQGNVRYCRTCVNKRKERCSAIISNIVESKEV